MADPCIIDTDCIALSGEGTLASPLQADIILDPDPDQAVECRPTGLWSDKCEISADDCNGIITYPDGHWASLIESRVGGATFAGGNFSTNTIDNQFSQIPYQSGSVVLSLNTCSPALIFATIKFGGIHVTSLTGGGRAEFEDQSRENNGAFTTYGFEVVDNSLLSAPVEYAAWPSTDANTMGVNTVSGTQYEIGFQRFLNMTAPAAGFESVGFTIQATEVDVRLISIAF